MTETLKELNQDNATALDIIAIMEDEYQEVEYVNCVNNIEDNEYKPLDMIICEWYSQKEYLTMIKYIRDLYNNHKEALSLFFQGMTFFVLGYILCVIVLSL